MHESLQEAFSLDGRVAVVTGAASGIGRQAAVTFAEAGAAAVVVADVDHEGLAETAELVGATDAALTVTPTDVSDRAAVDALAEVARREHGGLHVWANVAGLLDHALIVEATEDRVRRIVDVNLLGVYWGIAAAGRVMSANGGGSIINIASAGGDMGAPTLSIYGMTKAAVMHLTKTAALELGPSGVRVNAVAPGFIETPMVAIHWTGDDGVDEEAREEMLGIRAAQSPLGITGEPTDITYAMLYLAADASRFMTGQTLRPNGGVVMP